jgi:hypothetical protein
MQQILAHRAAGWPGWSLRERQLDFRTESKATEEHRYSVPVVDERCRSYGRSRARIPLPLPGARVQTCAEAEGRGCELAE